MDKEKELPTIEQFQDRYARSQGYRDFDQLMKSLKFHPLTLKIVIKSIAHEYAVLFAKWHREKAIEAIIEFDGDCMVVEDSIRNAYKEDRIV